MFKNITILKPLRFGSRHCFRLQVNGGEEEENTIQGWRLALSKGPNRVDVLFFFPSIHLKTEIEPPTET
jgi:hypothetical protein